MGKPFGPTTQMESRTLAIVSSNLTDRIIAIDVSIVPRRGVFKSQSRLLTLQCSPELNQNLGIETPRSPVPVGPAPIRPRTGSSLPPVFVRDFENVLLGDSL